MEENSKEIFEDAKNGSANNYDNNFSQSQTFANKTGIECLKKSEWNAKSEAAWEWFNSLSPFHLAKSEVEIFKTCFKKCNTYGNTPRILFWGYKNNFTDETDGLKYEINCVDSYEEFSNVANLHKGYYDIVIVNMLLGTVSPTELNEFFSLIGYCLKESGYFLGKNVYKYSYITANASQMANDLKLLVEEKCANNKANFITIDSFYSPVMCELALNALDPISSEDLNAYTINFEKLFDILDDFKENLSENLKNKLAVEEQIASGSLTEKNFYVYDYASLLKLFENNSLEIEKVCYSVEEYKDDFPLLIVKKCCKNENDISSNPRLINAFFSDIENVELNKWKDHIASVYFLSNLNDPRVKIAELPKKIEEIMNGTKIVIKTENDNIGYYLSEIKVESLIEETEKLINIIEGLSNSDLQELKSKMSLNYTCGILISLIKSYDKAKNKSSSLSKLLLYTLFAEDHIANGYWIPKKSTWLTARICICLFDLYLEWKQMQDSELSEHQSKYKKKLESSLNAIATFPIKDYNMFWMTETGSNLDTSALCLEALNKYRNYIEDKSNSADSFKSKAENQIRNVLQRYVLNGRIKETFIQRPLDEFLISQVIDKKSISSKYYLTEDGKELIKKEEKPTYKKMCGRVEWYTIVYKICREWYEDFQNLSKDVKTALKKNELKIAADVIKNKLQVFWNIFYEKKKHIIDKTFEDEKSIVPQIIYCLQSSGIIS